MIDEPLPTKLSVFTQGDKILVEPTAVHGVKGFTIILDREGAKAIAGRLLGCATRLLPPTTNSGQHG